VTVRSTPARPSTRRSRGPVGAEATPSRLRRRDDAPSSPNRVEPRVVASPPRPYTESERPSGRNGGEFLLLVFFGATILMVVAVVLVGAVGQWWVLVPVMLVDLTVTFAVLASIVRLLGDDNTPFR
jgi:hypothetical protein